MHILAHPTRRSVSLSLGLTMSKNKPKTTSEKELWNERNSTNQLKILGLNKSIDQPIDFLNVLPTTSRDLLSKASVKEVKYYEVKESNGTIRSFHIISCHNLQSISRQLFSAKSDEDFKSIGFLIRRSFCSKEKAWR